MYCSNCGIQLLDGTHFCPSCGKPQQENLQTVQTQSMEPTWETCEIVLDKRHDFDGWKYWFCIEVLSPKGLYTTGKTREVLAGSHIFDFPSNRDKTGVAVHTKLINDLLADGWEPVSERGVTWWNYRFRRQVGKESQKICEIEVRQLKMSLIPLMVQFQFIAVTKGVEHNVVLESAVITLTKRNEGLFPDKSKTTPEVIQAYNNFTNQIVQAGWEPVKEIGKNWWNTQYSQ